MYYTVEFVYSDEATPRELHTKSVKAANADDAKMVTVMEAALNGDRIETTGVMTNSWK